MSRHLVRVPRQALVRLLVIIGGVLAFGVIAGGCSANPAPAPTADPFASVAERSAAHEGHDLLAQGHSREALDAFRRAQLLSPTDDPETDATIATLASELAPTPVPVPPSATPTAQPTATPEPEPTLEPSPSVVPATLITVAQPAPTMQPQDRASAQPPAQPDRPAAPVAAPPEPAARGPAAPDRPAAPAPQPQPPPPLPAQPSTPQVIYVPVPAPPPTPTPAPAQAIYVADGPAAIAVGDSGPIYVADRVGSIWTVDLSRQTLRRPFSVAGEPVGLAFDAFSNRLYVAVRGQRAVAALDASTGQLLASVPLAADPSDLQLDRGAGLLLVAMPQHDAIERIELQTLHALESVGDLRGITGMATDEATHVLYVSQLDGQLVSVDVRAGGIRDRREVSGVGLSAVATASSRVFAINTPGQELLSLDPNTGEVLHFGLDAPPAAVVAGMSSGTVYVLEPAANAVVSIDPATGAELARFGLGDAHVEDAQLQPDQQWARPRVAIMADETVFIAAPSAGLVVRVPSRT